HPSLSSSRFPFPTLFRSDRHRLAVAMAPPDIAGNLALFMVRISPDDGPISAFNFFVPEKGAEYAVRLIIFGDHQRAAGTFIQPVHNAGTDMFAVRIGKLIGMPHEPVDQRTCPVSIR